jgi:hypothetical protein
MRFLIPLTPVLAVLAAEASNRMALVLKGTLTRWGRGAFYSSLAVLFILNLPPFIPLHETDRNGWEGWLSHVINRLPISVVTGRESQQDYLLRSLPSYGGWCYINTSLPEDARLLTFSGGDHFYSERERVWSDSTIARPAVWGASAGQEQQAIRTLSNLGITHVLFDKKQLFELNPGTLAIAQPSVVPRWYDKKYEDLRFVLYRIRWETLDKG